MGPERIGKTSLLTRVLTDMGVRPMGWKVDRLLPPSFRRLVESMFATAVERHPDEPPLADLLERLSLNFDRTVGDVLPQFGRLLGRLRPVPMVVLDDANPLLAWGPAEQATVRAFLDRAACPVVVALHTPLGEDRPPPLFDGFRPVVLGAVSRADLRSFLERRFAAAGLSAEREALLAIESYARHEPYYAQLLGLRTWEAARRLGAKRVDLDTFGEGLASALDALPPDLVGPFDRLEGTTRAVFVALCTLPDASPTALGRALDVEPKNVTVFLQRLVTHGLVRKTGRGAYEAAHPLLREAVKKEWARSTL